MTDSPAALPSGPAAPSRAARRPLDRYDTPAPLCAAVVRALALPAGLRVLEPSVGAGHWVGPLLATGAELWVNDVDPAAEGLGMVRGVRRSVGRFEDLALPPGAAPFDLIVMNPPYSAIDAHLAHAMALARRVVLVCRSTWLVAASRRSTLAQLPPRQIWLPSPRPSFVPGGSTDAAPAAVLDWTVGLEAETRFELLAWSARPVEPGHPVEAALGAWQRARGARR
jgi:hypothetical protein